MTNNTHCSFVESVIVNQTEYIAKYYDCLCKSYLTEVKILSTIKHSNIMSMINILSKTSNNKTYFGIMMPFESDNLSNYLENRELKLKEKINFLVQIASGLDHLHQNRIVHLDLKLDNLTITNGRIKIIDFGSAEFLNGGELYTPEVKCTATHRPPEGFVTFKSDYFANFNYLSNKKIDLDSSDEEINLIDSDEEIDLDSFDEEMDLINFDKKIDLDNSNEEIDFNNLREKIYLRDKSNYFKIDYGFDVWSFGIIMYELLSGIPIYLQDIIPSYSEEKYSSIDSNKIYEKMMLKCIMSDSFQSTIRKVLPLNFMKCLNFEYGARPPMSNVLVELIEWSEWSEKI